MNTKINVLDIYVCKNWAIMLLFLPISYAMVQYFLPIIPKDLNLCYSFVQSRPLLIANNDKTHLIKNRHSRS